MLLVGFGWAKPVPVDMRYFKKPKQGMALTALAGPVSNLLLAVLLLLGVRITIAHYVDTAFCSALLNFLARTAYMSVGLGLFNLIPISPLDGSKVLFAFLPDRAYLTLMRYEKYGMVLLLLLVWLGVGDKILGEGIYLSLIHISYTDARDALRRGFVKSLLTLAAYEEKTPVSYTHLDVYKRQGEVFRPAVPRQQRRRTG